MADLELLERLPDGCAQERRRMSSPESMSGSQHPAARENPSQSQHIPDEEYQETSVVVHPQILAFKYMRQECSKFEAGVGYRARLGATESKAEAVECLPTMPKVLGSRFDLQ